MQLISDILCGIILIKGFIVGALTTHILDTANGVPAAGVKIEVWEITENGKSLLKTAHTNDDGRLDTPALEGAAFKNGNYELVFFMGDYFRRLATIIEPAFLDIIPLRFGVANCDSHYHVPLLASPFSYSTYRGS